MSTNSTEVRTTVATMLVQAVWNFRAAARARPVTDYTLCLKYPRALPRITANALHHLPNQRDKWPPPAPFSLRNSTPDVPPPNPPDLRSSAARMTAAADMHPPPTAVRVLFSDGAEEIDAGEVLIDPSLTFQRFQSLVGDVIGVSPHRIKLFLLRQKKARSGRPPPEIRRRTPIGEGTDFATVAREEGGAVLAQLKRTRKDRRGRGHGNRVGGGAVSYAPEKAAPQRPVEFHGGASAASIVPAAKDNGAGLVGLFNYENLRELQRRRERELLAAAAAAYYGYAGGAHGYDAAGYGGGGVAVCGVCSAAAGGRAAPFHWCVRDRVVAEGFRSSAGPIQRPPKSAVHASA